MEFLSKKVAELSRIIGAVRTYLLREGDGRGAVKSWGDSSCDNEGNLERERELRHEVFKAAADRKSYREGGNTSGTSTLAL